MKPSGQPYTGLDYADQRFYASTYGRFNSPDRKGGKLGSPSSLNRYSYVKGDPINSNDPRGLCTVMIAGITMGPGDSSPYWTSEASALQADTAYPYAGQTFGQSILSVAQQGKGPNAATYAAYNTILTAEASSSTPVDIVAYSGGAAAFAAAWKLLSSAQQADIGKILYIAPGSAGAVLPSNGQTSTATGTGFANAYANGGTTPVGSPINTNWALSENS